jgi:hypothetical protein
MNTYRAHLTDFEQNSCLYTGNYENFSYLAERILPELDFECSKPIALMVSGCLLGFAIAVAAASACCYRHRWEIRYACLKLTQRGQLYQQLVDKTADYEYDAFVVYDIEDREWVNERLVPQLEQHFVRERSVTTDLMNVQQVHGHEIRLCIHERDFPPGQEIISNIWKRMERSRTVILVISKNFTRSQYCNYEMNLARMKSVEKGCNVLIPIVLDWPEVEEVSECLHWVLRKLTYIRWTEHEGESTDFWQTLRTALRLDDNDN